MDYTCMSTQELIDALRLRDQQNAMQGEMLESVRRANTNQMVSLEQERERVAALIREKTQAEVDLLDAQEARARAERHHADDVALIGEHLLEEAERRDWCSDFDDAVETLNARLHVELPRRVRDWQVMVEVTVSVPVVVSAVSEDDARREAADDWRDRWDSYDAADRIVSGTTGDSDEFDVEEIDR